MRRTAIALTFAVALAVAAPAQEPPPPGEEPSVFRESVEVHVMDLDVVVTDSRGQSIPDVKREEFTVRVDGRPVPIDYFARVEEGTIHAPDLASASPDRVLAEYRKGGEAYVPRHFLLYVDAGHLSPGSRNRALEALRDLVTRLGPSDTARIVLFDRRGKPLTDWTPSKEALLAALSKIERSGVGMSRLLTERQTLQEIDSATGFRRSSREFLARNYAEQERAEVQTLLENMDGELSTLTPLPGKKAFVYVSGGFEMQPGYAMMTYALGAFGLSSISVRNVSKEVEQMARRANASEITFYTVDARGLTAEGISAAEDDPLASRPGIALFAREDSQAGLQTLARETGGLAVINTNSLTAGLTQAYRDASTYYSVGVNLAKLEGSGYRDVRVEVSRPGVTVRTRRGYAPRSEEDRLRDNTRATLLTNVEYRAFPVTLKTAPPTKLKKYFGLPIQVSMPASALTFVPDGEGSRAAADVYVGAVDDAGRLSDISHDQVLFRLPKDATPETPVTWEATLQTRKGSYRIVVNVRDRATGEIGTAKADVRIE